MTFKTIEEIIAWQLPREICRLVRVLTEKEGFSRDWELRKQIRNAAGSAMDCIAEGFERRSNNEFRYFLGISQGSCGEIRSQGYRALDYGYITEDERIGLERIFKRTSSAIQSLIDYLNQTNYKGTRNIPLNKNDRHPKDPPLSPE
jgi:four helix bundle protein